jgi:hypothetical protein
MCFYIVDCRDRQQSGDTRDGALWTGLQKEIRVVASWWHPDDGIDSEPRFAPERRLPTEAKSLSVC